MASGRFPLGGVGDGVGHGGRGSGAHGGVERAEMTPLNGELPLRSSTGAGASTDDPFLLLNFQSAAVARDGGALPKPALLARSSPSKPDGTTSVAAAYGGTAHSLSTSTWPPFHASDGHSHRPASAATDFIWDKMTPAQLNQLIGDGCLNEAQAPSRAAVSGGGDGRRNDFLLPHALNADLYSVLFGDDAIAPAASVSSAGDLDPGALDSAAVLLPTTLVAAGEGEYSGAIGQEESLDSEGLSLGGAQSEGSLGITDDLGGLDAPATEIPGPVDEMVELGPWLANHLPATRADCRVRSLK